MLASSIFASLAQNGRGWPGVDWRGVVGLKREISGCCQQGKLAAAGVLFTL
jgi:hypothetical protein